MKGFQWLILMLKPETKKMKIVSCKLIKLKRNVLENSWDLNNKHVCYLAYNLIFPIQIIHDSDPKS
jgi:hypothetical protein